MISNWIQTTVTLSEMRFAACVQVILPMVLPNPLNLFPVPQGIELPDVTKILIKRAGTARKHTVISLLATTSR